MAKTEQYIFDLIDEMSPKIDNINKNMKKFDKSVSKTSQKGDKGFKSLGKSAGVLKAGIFGLAAFAGGKLVQGFIKAGSQVEDLETQFTTILGTTGKAKARIAELTNFAAKTPFQLAGVAQSSKILETLTEGVLSTGDGLRLVGDVAAASGADFVNLSTHVGRLYSGLQANRPVGESMARLQELGIVSGKVRNKVEALQKAGKGKEAWKVMQAELKKSNGGMERMSKTVSGLTSTLKDQLQMAMVKLMSSGVWSALSKGLTTVTAKFSKILESGNIEKFGKSLVEIAKIISGVVMGSFNMLMSGINTVMSFVGRAVQKTLQAITKLSSFLPEKLRPNWTKNLDGLTKTFEIFADDTNAKADEFAAKAVVSFDKTIEKVKNFKKEISKPAEDVAVGISSTGGGGGSTASAGPDQAAIDAAKETEDFIQEIKNEASLIGLENRDLELQELQLWHDEKFILAQSDVEAQLVLQDLFKAKESEINKFYNQKMADDKKKIRDKEIAQEEKDIKKREADKKMLQKAAMASLKNVSNSILSMVQSRNAKETQIQIAKVKASTASEADKEKQINAINKSAFEKHKRMAIAQAVIDGALSFIKTMAQYPFPANLILAALGAIPVGIQIGTIASQKFQSGGVVQSDGSSQTGDSTLVRANPGELVLTKQQQQQRQGGQPTIINIGDTNITVNGNADEEVINNNIDQRNNLLMNQLNDLIEQGRVQEGVTT